MNWGKKEEKGKEGEQNRLGKTFEKKKWDLHAHSLVASITFGAISVCS